AAIFIRLSDIVRANRDQPAIGNLKLTIKCNKRFSLPAVLGAETSAAEDEHHGILSLQFGELSAFRSVVGELIVGEFNSWNNVRSHRNSSGVGCAPPGYVSIFSDRRSRSAIGPKGPPGPPIRDCRCRDGRFHIVR